MKQLYQGAFLWLMLMACGKETAQNSSQPTANPMVGTWQLVTGTLIEKGDTILTDYTQNKSFIKLINDTHFAFIGHDLTQGKDSAAFFTAGGGSYTLADSLYTEQLDYCSDRSWEGHHFSFIVTIKNDTLIQRGTEVVESEGINRVNIEKYIRAAL